MRTTLTLADDVAEKLRAEARRSGRSFKDLVNEVLRRGLAQRAAGRRAPFRVVARDLGHLKPGLSLDSVADVIERVEGSSHR